MIDQARYKAWRSGPEPELHVIVYEGADLPPGISGLGPWLGSKEGEVADMKSHYVFGSRLPLCTIHRLTQLHAGPRGDDLSCSLCLTWDIRA